MLADILSTADHTHEGEALISLMMERGRRVAPQPSLQEIRAYARKELGRLPQGLDVLKPTTSYVAHVAQCLERLAFEVDRRMNPVEVQEK